MTARFRFIFFYCMIVLTWACIHLPSIAAVPVAKPLSDFPAICHEWRMTSQTRFSEDILNVLKPTDYLSRSYEGSNIKNVGLYIGYHDGSGKRLSLRFSGAQHAYLSVAGELLQATPVLSVRPAKPLESYA